MYFIALRAAAALTLGAALAPALADDAGTCKMASGDDSIAACTRLLARTNDAGALYNRGYAYEWRKGDHDRAIADFDQAIILNPKYALAYAGRGFSHEHKGEWDRAFDDFDQAILFDAKIPDAWNGRGNVYAHSGDHDRAIADYDEALRLNPKFVIVYSNRGGVYAAKGEHDRAIADFEQAIQLDPTLVVAYMRRGDAYERKGEYDRAIASYDQAIRLDPKLVVAYTGRGNAHERKGEYDRAIASYEQAIRLDPKRAVTYSLRGYAHSFKGEYDLAIADFNQALQLDPKLPVAYGGRCGAWNGKGQYDRAIADCEEGMKVAPRLANAYSNRGFAYGKKGIFDRAMTDLDKAIALNPTYARGYSHRGAIYELQGDLGRAIADYDQALKILPTLAEARLSQERARAALAARPAVAKPDVAKLDPVKPVAVAPDRRVALVIGNSQYRSAAFLPNPRRDASAVADALRQVGFQVELATDLDRDGMAKALRSFRERADKADWALVYFAGHGIEIDRVNYLIPTDARLADDRDVKAETVSYEDVLNTVNGARALRMVLLDACRVNPFKDKMRRIAATRGAIGRGLAPAPESKPGTLVVYAAKEGEVAEDDAGGANSPFASALIAELKVPGLEVRRVFDNIRDDVLEATDNRQQPYVYSSVPGRKDFFFVAGR
jgi:tetratricopeptide (TPR) repeat protein